MTTRLAGNLSSSYNVGQDISKQKSKKKKKK